MQIDTLQITPADYRAAVARTGKPQYVIAALARIHPATFSKMLRGRHPISREHARRILAAVGQGGEKSGD